jgi:hypothetical protein
MVLLSLLRSKYSLKFCRWVFLWGTPLSVARPQDLATKYSPVGPTTLKKRMRVGDDPPSSWWYGTETLIYSAIFLSYVIVLVGS